MSMSDLIKDKQVLVCNVITKRRYEKSIKKEFPDGYWIGTDFTELNTVYIVEDIEMKKVLIEMCEKQEGKDIMITTEDFIKVIEGERRVLTKDKECIECERLFKCPGKPQEVEYCLHFLGRGKDNDSKRLFDADREVGQADSE